MPRKIARSSPKLSSQTITSINDILYKPKFTEIRYIYDQKPKNLLNKKENYKKKYFDAFKSVNNLIKFLSLNTYMHMHNIIIILIISVFLKRLDFFIYFFSLRVLISYLQNIYKQIKVIMVIDRNI